MPITPRQGSKLHADSQATFGMESETLEPSVMEAFKFHFKAGHGGYPLVGTPEQIVDEMNKLIDIGVDGMLISWVDYKTECRQWIDRVMPLMEQAGQRKPFTASVSPA